MRMSIKLTLLVAVMLALAALIGFSGLYNMRVARDRLDATLATMNHIVDLNEDLDGANIEFKSQVQAWKDLLLRGRDVKDYDNYIAAFHKQEALVQDRLQKTRTAALALALDGRQFDELAKEHRELSVRYMDALKSGWNASDENSYRVVDKQIRGIDRKLSQDMDRISLSVVADAEKRSKALADAAAAEYASARTSMLIGLVVTLLLGAGLATWIIRSVLRQLGADPAYASEVVQAVAAGDLTIKVATAANDQTSLLFAMKTMIGKLSQVIGEVRSSADTLSSASEEVNATAQAMSQASSEQAASVEETSASVEQMTASPRTAATPRSPTAWPCRPRPRPPTAAPRWSRRCRR